ncbi:MAG: hypothetical protein FJZ07_02125 [Candidatus Nealsonbacteria bacterium]|nr:hypothetical protein [Candidatus Nealsonbacteria bacterium]
MITKAILALPGLFLAVLGFFTNLFAQIAIFIFNWITGPTFITWRYTQNPVVEVGLGITKQFVNMGLVVVLIFIALAIALRLQEYASQKTLIRLIAVALLVNFAPVLCGLIVDAANIIMNYFLSPIQEGANRILGGVTGSFELFKNIMTSRLRSEELLGLFGKLAVIVIFNAIIGFTFLLLAFIFLIRYIAIWVLVILAPLAFVAWILPATKKFWDQWWQQFIQWSIIGIPLAFFVYLAISSLGAIETELIKHRVPTFGLTEGGAEAINYFNQFFGYGVVVVLIWLGIIIGLQTSAMGAGSIINFAKTLGKGAVKLTARGTWGVTKWGARKVRKGADLARENIAKTEAGKKAQQWGQRQLARKPFGEGKAGFWGAMARATSKINPGRYFVRGLARAAGGALPEDQRRDIKNAEDSVKDVEETSVLLKKFHDSVLDTKRIGILNKIIEKGKLKDAMDVEKFGESAIDEKEAKRLMKHAKNWETDKFLMAAFPHVAAEHVTKDELAKAKAKDPTITSAEDLIISKLKSTDYKNISEGALDLNVENNVKTVDAILRRAMGSHISQLIEKHGRTAVDAIRKRILQQRGGEQGKGDIIISQSLESYLRSGAGQATVGIQLPDRPVHSEPDEYDNRGRIIKRGKPFKPGYLRREDILVFIDSEEKMKTPPVSPPTSSPPPPKEEPKTMGEVKGGAKTIGEVMKEKKNKKIG